MARRSVKRVVGMVFGTEWVGGTKAHFVHCLLQMATEFLWLAQGTQSAKGAFAIGCRREDQYASHRLPIIWISGVNPLRDRGRGVAAFNGKLAYDVAVKSVRSITQLDNGCDQPDIQEGQRWWGERTVVDGQCGVNRLGAAPEAGLCRGPMVLMP